MESRRLISFRTSRPTLLLASLALGIPGSAAAEWTKFENSSFVAYSNAAEADARGVLIELEYIRAAAEQVPSFVIPADRPRTLVILPATHEEFLHYAALDSIAGFAQPLDGGAAIVMPVAAPSGNAGDVIRHEFAHTLLFNDWFRYPQWYSEGFAEIFSNIRVDSRHSSFVIGERPERYGRRLRPGISWDTLVDENFDAHMQPDQEVVQAAYGQAWLLVHYLTLSGDPDHLSQLNHYFSLVNSGSPSVEAFTRAFGVSPASLWGDTLASYVEHPETARYEFSPAVLDPGFRSAPADEREISPILAYLRDKADALRPGGNPDMPASMLAGSWDRLKYKNQCSDPLTFASRENGEVISIDGFYSAEGTDPVPALFVADRMAPGVYDFINITAEEFPEVVVAADYQLTIRSESVVCFDRRPFSRACTSVLQRCSN